ncbi:hypothetical protein JCM19037_744 [Geomicrobium sp. JCM 19037]|nr:hypothetical protein JCM19037_744 [Geomicrobium sp. JCM 19037]
MFINEQEVQETKKLYTLAADDVMTLHLPGGGGFGDLKQRSAESKAYDERNGYVLR